MPLITAVLFCRTGNSNSESILLVEDNSNCRRPLCSPEKVREAGTVVQEALHEVEDEIPPEEVKAKLALVDQRDIYYSIQLGSKRWNRYSEWGKGLLSLVQVVKQTWLRLVLFSLPRNDVSTPLLKLKLTTEGQLILLAGASIISMNQICFTHEQAWPTEGRPSLLLFMLSSMVPTVHSTP